MVGIREIETAVVNCSLARCLRAGSRYIWSSSRDTDREISLIVKGWIRTCSIDNASRRRRTSSRRGTDVFTRVRTRGCHASRASWRSEIRLQSVSRPRQSTDREREGNQEPEQAPLRRLAGDRDRAHDCGERQPYSRDVDQSKRADRHQRLGSVTDPNIPVCVFTGTLVCFPSRSSVRRHRHGYIDTIASRALGYS